MDSENVEGQVEDAVESAQRLDAMRQAILEEVGASGGLLLVANTVSGELRVDDLS